VLDDQRIKMCLNLHHDAYNGNMRTTINLDDDVASEVAKLQRERGLGLSAAVNELARAGFRTARQEYNYEHVSYDMGALVDLSDVADVLDLLDEADRPTGSAHAS
jgi:Arc/MetJ family transcription regulator